MAKHPACVLVFSGKRKSGKDYVTEILQRSIGKDKCSILRLSGPLKGQYAKEHNLDFQRLLDASDYKEKYRADMILWGEEKRNSDPGYFARLICEGPASELPVWIISDARRKTDIEYFKDHYNDVLLTVRVEAESDVRAARGWTFTQGVDDAESECGLDNRKDWDFTIENNSDNDKLNEQLTLLIGKVNSCL